MVVDTSKKTLESVTPLSDERAIGYAVTYVHCTFSKHFNDVAGIHAETTFLLVLATCIRSHSQFRLCWYLSHLRYIGLNTIC